LQELVGDAVFKRLSFALILIVALCACSKKDDSTGNNVQPSPVSASDPSKDTSTTANSTEPGSKTESAPKTDPPSGSSEGDKGTSKEAAIPTEEKDKKQKKQVENRADGSAKKGTRSAMRGRWDQFQSMVNKCDANASSAREECLAKARDTFRAANFKCEALGSQRRTACLEFAERWNNPVADSPRAPVKHVEEPALTATDPGDPRPAERNRDSTKQH